KLYDISDYIGCMSPANEEFLRKNNNLGSKRIEECPNSITPIERNINEKEKNIIKNKYLIPKNKTIFIYGGNIGKPQGVNFIIDCLKETKNDNKSYFLIVGSGTELHKIEKYIEEYQPQNVKLINYLPKKDYD